MGFTLVGELRFCMPDSLAKKKKKKKVHKSLKQYLHIWKLLSKNWNVWPHSGDSGGETLLWGWGVAFPGDSVCPSPNPP